MTDLDPATCPQCGPPISSGGTPALCPRCVLADAPGGESRDSPVALSSPAGAPRKGSLTPAPAAIGAILLGGLWIGKSWGRPSEAMGHCDPGIGLFAQGRPTRRSPNTARRSESSPITPRPTTTSASPCQTRVSWTKRSPNTAQQSAQARSRQGSLQPRPRAGKAAYAGPGDRRTPHGPRQHRTGLCARPVDRESDDRARKVEPCTTTFPTPFAAVRHSWVTILDSWQVLHNPIPLLRATKVDHDVWCADNPVRFPAAQSWRESKAENPVHSHFGWTNSCGAAHFFRALSSPGRRSLVLPLTNVIRSRVGRECPG